MPITTEQARRALQAQGGENAKAVAADAELLGKLVDMLNGTLAAGEGRLAGVLGYIDKNAALCDVVVRGKDAKTVKAASASVQILTQTLALLKLGSQASPAMVTATVGAMFSKKVALAFGLAENDKQAKLVSVVADMAAGVTTAGIAFATAATPFGWVLFVGALASAGLSTYNASLEISGQP
jgi:hypothetical protein